MIGTILGWVLQFLGSNVVSQVLGYFEKKADNDTQREKIRSIRDQHAMDVQADVIKTGMSHNWFWYPWLIATVPMAMWFGHGMLCTEFPNYIPPVATIPPGLQHWAEIAWANLFYAGGGVASASILGKAITSFRR